MKLTLGGLLGPEPFPSCCFLKASQAIRCRFSAGKRRGRGKGGRGGSPVWITLTALGNSETGLLRSFGQELPVQGGILPVQGHEDQQGRGKRPGAGTCSTYRKALCLNAFVSHLSSE